MNEKITMLQQITPYVGPQWLVRPRDTSLTDEQTEITAVEATGYTILDRDIIGWGEYNAIIRVTDGEVIADYLAHLAAT